MKGFLCLLFGHDWEIKKSELFLDRRICRRCERNELFAHMSYIEGWKWIRAEPKIVVEDLTHSFTINKK